MRTRAPMLVSFSTVAPRPTRCRLPIVTRSRTTARSPTITLSASVVPANTTAPVEIVQFAPIVRPGSGPRLAVELPPSAGRLPSTALSPTSVPAPIEQPSCTTTLAPNSTPSPIVTSSPTCRFGPRGSRLRLTP